MNTTKLEVIDGDAVDVSDWSGVEGSPRTVSMTLLPAAEPGAPAGSEVRRDQRGMVSAEWAVGIIAAIGIAGVLIAVVTNGAVQDALLKFVLQLIHSFSGFMVNR